MNLSLLVMVQTFKITLYYTEDPGCPCIVEDNVTVGHMVMLHGCKIGSGSLVGIGAVILNNVIVGKNCIIGAKALITEGTIIPDGSMVMGMPGKIKRELTPEEQELTKMNAEFMFKIISGTNH